MGLCDAPTPSFVQEVQALGAELASLQERHEQHSAASKREAESLLSSR